MELVFLIFSFIFIQVYSQIELPEYDTIDVEEIGDNEKVFQQVPSDEIDATFENIRPVDNFLTPTRPEILKTAIENHQIENNSQIINPMNHPVTIDLGLQANLDYNLWKQGFQENIHTKFNHNIYQGKTSDPRSDQDDPFTGIRLPAEEEIYWRRQPQEHIEQYEHVIYDTQMNHILNVLDERSNSVDRPEIATSSKTKNAETEHWNGKSDFYFSDERKQEPKEKLGDSNDADYNLRSPNLVQVPFNNFYHSYGYGSTKRIRRSPKDINLKILSDNYMNFNISSWQLKEISSKLNDTLQEYQDVVDEYRKKITDKRELVFADILDGFIGQYRQKDKDVSNKMRNIEKRSATITKLLNNPDARLDVPKTLDNIGVITRNAFEDKRSPIYHVRQFIGSTKNAVLSAMKIPPQNLIIPSNYEIKNINPEEISYGEDTLVNGINPKILSRSAFRTSENSEFPDDTYSSDPYGIVETFARVGGAIRDSVRSSQNTLTHISNIAHDAKKIFHTTKNTVPRVLLPYSKAPVLTSRFQGKHKAPLNKAIIISPKVLDVKDPVLSDQRSEPEYVSMGNILDAIGLTKPDKDQIDLEKIVVEMPGHGVTRGIYIPPNGEVKSVIGKKIPNSEDKKKIKWKTKGYLGRKQEKVTSTNELIKQNAAETKNANLNTLDEIEGKIKSDYDQTEGKYNIVNPSNNLNRKKGENSTKVSMTGLRHFTKQEEDQIIDRFLHNIFKINANLNYNPKPLVSLKKNETETKSDEETQKENKNDHLLELSSGYIPDETEADYKTIIKILGEKNGNKELLRKNSEIKNSVKPNEKYRKKSKLFLESRFGEDVDSFTEKIEPSTTSKINQADKNDEEAMRKVYEYVLNDIFTPSLSESTEDANLKSSSKVGNLSELIEQTSIEVPSNEIGSRQNNERDRMPTFSSRNLLWYYERENENETEGKTLESMDQPSLSIQNGIASINNGGDDIYIQPVMDEEPPSNVQNANIDISLNTRGFKNRQAETHKNNPSIHPSPHNTEGVREFRRKGRNKEIVSMNLSQDLMKPFMARHTNADIDRIFTSDETIEQNMLSDNDDFRNDLSLLMMPHITDKSVKKTMDDFLKMGNNTRQQTYNTKENCLNTSNQVEFTEKPHHLAHPVEEQLFIIPSSKLTQKMISRVSVKENCHFRRCYQSPEDIPDRSYDHPQSFYICICITENTPVSMPSEYQDRFYPHYHDRKGTENDESSYKKKNVGHSRTAMDVNENLRKPFMGLGNAESIKEFYEEYNTEHEDEGDILNSHAERMLFSD